MVKKLRKGEKKFLFFFYNLVHIFPLPLRKNTKPLTFSALFITRNRKTVWENIPCKIFLFLVVYIRLVLEHLARKTYLAYIHSNPNCPCTPNTPDLHAGLPNSACTKNTFFALARQFCMYAKHIWPTVRFRFRFRLYRLGVLDHIPRKTYIYMHLDPNSACTENTPGLHTQLPQFCMYGKHAWPTYTITPILHVRRSLFSYTRQFCMFTYGAGGFWTSKRKTYHIYMHSDPNSACTHLALGIRFRFRLYAKHAQQPEVGLGAPRRRAGPCKEDY